MVNLRMEMRNLRGGFANEMRMNNLCCLMVPNMRSIRESCAKLYTGGFANTMMVWGIPMQILVWMVQLLKSMVTQLATWAAGNAGSRALGRSGQAARRPSSDDL